MQNVHQGIIKNVSLEGYGKVLWYITDRLGEILGNYSEQFHEVDKCNDLNP